MPPAKNPYRRDGLVFLHLESRPAPSPDQLRAELRAHLHNNEPRLGVDKGPEHLAALAKNTLNRLNANETKLVGPGDMLPDALETFRRRAAGEELPLPLPWDRVSKCFRGGLFPGCHVHVGLTGSGKSQYALEIARHAATLGVPTVYVALELGNQDIAARLLAPLLGVGWSDLYVGLVPPKLLSAAEEAAAALEPLPLRFAFGSATGWPIDSLPDYVEQCLEEFPTPHQYAPRALVVIDFLQLVGDQVLEQSRDVRDRIARASYAARDLARSQNVTVLLVSSVARDRYQKLSGEQIHEFLQLNGRLINPYDLVGSGKESGEIEYAADSVMVAMPWPHPLNARTAREGKFEIVLALCKLRYGETGWTSLRFNGEELAQPTDGGAALLQSLEEVKNPQGDDDDDEDRPKRKGGRKGARSRTKRVPT